MGYRITPAHNKTPSALSAEILEPGIYVHVLCRIQKFPLSRIWTHLVRLEEI